LLCCYIAQNRCCMDPRFSESLIECCLTSLWEFSKSSCVLC
jgi:hypothetical protein